MHENHLLICYTTCVSHQSYVVNFSRYVSYKVASNFTYLHAILQIGNTRFVSRQKYVRHQVSPMPFQSRFPFKYHIMLHMYQFVSKVMHKTIYYFVPDLCQICKVYNFGAYLLRNADQNRYNFFPNLLHVIPLFYRLLPFSIKLLTEDFGVWHTVQHLWPTKFTNTRFVSNLLHETE